MHFLAKKLLETRVPLCGLGGNPREKPRKRNGLDLEAHINLEYEYLQRTPFIHTLSKAMYPGYFPLDSRILKAFSGLFGGVGEAGGSQSWRTEGQSRFCSLPEAWSWPQSELCQRPSHTPGERTVLEGSQGSTEASRPRTTASQLVILLLVIFMLMTPWRWRQRSHTSGGLPSLLQFFFN